MMALAGVASAGSIATTRICLTHNGAQVNLSAGGQADGPRPSATIGGQQISIVCRRSNTSRLIGSGCGANASLMESSEQVKREAAS